MYNFNNVSSLGESESLIFDVSGNEHNGGIQTGNVIFTTSGRYGGAFNFNQSCIRVITNDLKTHNSTGSVWIKITQGPAGREPLDCVKPYFLRPAPCIESVRAQAPC